MNTTPVTLITGTRKGLGKFLAEYYVKKGHIVYGCSRSPADWTLPGYTHFECDVNEESSVIALFKTIQKAHGRLDHLINNAGIASMNHMMLTPTSTVDQILKTNVLGTYLFTREAARLMQKNKFGRIINFSTVAVNLKLDGEAIYAASKAAVNSLTEILAKELSDFGITVNAVAPTPIETDLIKNVPREKLDRIIKRLTIRRLGKPEDVSNVCDFFLSPQSDYITGQIIYLGGV